MIKTVEWTSEGVIMIDQRLLPNEEKYLTLRSYEEVAEAIKKMVVRGAPAIGISAAMGLALGAKQSVGADGALRGAEPERSVLRSGRLEIPCLISHRPPST